MNDPASPSGRVDEMWAHTRRLREEEPSRPRLGQPQPEVQALLWLVGDWRLVVDEVGTPQHPGESVEGMRHITTDLNGTWLHIADVFDDGVWTRHLTFDPLTAQWIEISRNTLGTANLVRYPAWQGETHTYEAEITYLGVNFRQRVTTRFARPDSFIEEMEEQLPDGTWRLSETLRCTRVA